jgi:CRISPR-associated protein Csd2
MAVQSKKELVRGSGLLIFVAEQCNPNGDPDAEGRPRVLTDGRGMVTDVCLKRRYRSLFEDHQSPSFRDLSQLLRAPIAARRYDAGKPENITLPGLSFEDERHYVWESISRGSLHQERDESEAALNEARASFFEGDSFNRDKFLGAFHDVRLFGCTVLEEKKCGGNEEEDDSTNRKTKKAKNGNRFSEKRTGVVTMSPAVSVGMVEIRTDTITKLAPLRVANMQKAVGDIAPGGRTFVQYGVYVSKIVANPHHAAASGTTQEDLEVFLRSLKFALTNSTSATRPNGLEVSHLWWKDHTRAIGSYNHYEWWRMLTPRKIKNEDGPSSDRSDFHFPEPNGDELTRNTINFV